MFWVRWNRLQQKSLSPTQTVAKTVPPRAKSPATTRPENAQPLPWRLHRLVVATVCLTLTAAPTAEAINYQWVGGGSNNNWGTINNWIGSIPPTKQSSGTTTHVYMEGSGGTSDLADFANNDADWELDSIVFESALTGGLEIIGGKLILSNVFNGNTKIIRNEDGNTHRFNNERVDLLDIGGFRFEADNGDLAFDTDVHFRINNSTLTASGGNDIYFNNGIKGDSFIDNATLSINEGTRAHIGGSSSVLTNVTISDGILRIASNSNLGDGVNITTFSNGTFDVNNFTENVDRITGSGTVDLGSGSLTFGDSGSGTSGDFTFSGNIIGTGNLTKNQSGTTTLSGSNTYTGNTSITGGTLALSGSGRLSNSTDVNVSSGATFDLNGITDEVKSISGGGIVQLDGGELAVNQSSNSVFFGGRILGGGTLRKLGGHTLDLSGNNDFDSLIISSGTVSVSNEDSLGASDADILLDSSLHIDGNVANGRTIYLENGIVYVEPSFTLTQSGVVRNNLTSAESLTKNGSGTMVLTAGNTYTGDTILNSGRLEINGNSERIHDLSDLVMNGGTFDLNNRTETVSGLTGSLGTIVDTGGSSGRLIVNQVENRTFSGVISNGGGLTKRGNGVLDLAGSNTYDGSTRIEDGTLKLTGNGSLDSTTDVSVSNGAVFDLNGNSDTVDSIAGAGNILLGGASLNVDQTSGTTTFSGTITENGSISKTGGHKLILSGTNFFTGGVAIFGGAISVGADNNLGASSGDITLAVSGELETTGSFTTARDIQFGMAASPTIDTAAGTTLTHTGSLSGGTDVTLNKDGGGTYKLGAANAGFNGDINVNNGIFEIASFSGDALGNNTRITVNENGLLVNNQTEGFGSLAGRGNTITNSTFEVGFDNTSTLYEGTITGNVGGGFVGKAGTGTMTITKPQAYSGRTEINGGTLKLDSTGGLPDTSDVDVATGTTFDLNNRSDTIDALTGSGSVQLGVGALTIGNSNGSGTFSGVISESGSATRGALVKVGSGTQTLTGNNTYTQKTRIEGGRLSIGTSSNLGSGAIELDNGGRLQVTGNTTNSRTVTVQSNGGAIGVSGGRTVTQSGTISGPGDFEKADAGTLVLSSNNTYGGVTDITGGILRLNFGGQIPDESDVQIGSGALLDMNGVGDTVSTISGTGNVTLGNAILTLIGNDTDTYTLSGVLSESGALIKDGNHTLQLAGANTFLGPINVLDGVLSVANNSNLGAGSNTITLTDGTLTATGSFTMPRTLTMSDQDGTIDVATSFLTVNQPIVGPGQLTKTGFGRLSLSANNTYSGGTVIEGGSVEVLQNQGLGANSGAVTLATGTLLVTGDFTNQHPLVIVGAGTVDVEGGYNLTHNQSLTGNGLFEKDGDGLLVLNSPATHAGNTEINGGTLRLAAGAGLPDLFDVSVNGATWDLNGVDDTIDALFVDSSVLLGGATLTIGAADGGDVIEGSLVGPGTLVKVGTAETQLEGINSHTFTQINGGALRAGADNALGAAAAPLGLDGGTLHASGTFTMPRDVTLDPLGGTFDINNMRTLTIANPVTGPGGLTKIGLGTLILAANSNFGGPMSVLEGQLQLGTGMTFGGLSGSGDIDLGLYELIVNSTGNDVYSGVISGLGGKLTKDGPGTLTLTGVNTYTGGTCILDGVLSISQDANLGEEGGPITFAGGALNTSDSFGMTRGIIMNTGAIGTIDVDATTQLAQSGPISGDGGLRKTGDGTLQLTGGFSTYAGGTEILAGEVSINRNFNLGDPAGPLSIDTGSLHTSDSVSMARSTTIGAGGGAFRTDGGTTLTHSGAIAGTPGAAGVTKRGTGDLRLSGSNTFGGDVVMQEGRLQVDNSAQLGDAGNLLRMQGGALHTLANMTNSRTIHLEDGAAANTIETNANTTLTQSGVITDGAVGPAQPLAKSGAGTLQLTASNTYTSATQVNAGTLRLAGSGQLPDVTDVNVGSGATFDLNNVNDAIDGLSGSGDVALGTGTLTVGADDGGATFQGVISGSGGLTKVGSGTQSLRTKMVGEDTFPSTYTGGTAINGGILDVFEDTNLGDTAGPLSFDTGTLRLSAQDSSFNTMRVVTSNSGGGTVDVADMSSVTFGNVIGGAGAITKDGLGMMTYQAANTYTGDTTINRGILRLDTNGRIADVSNVIVNAPGEFDLNNVNDAINGLYGNGELVLGTGRLTIGAGNGAGDHTGVISGDGGITKTGSGTQVLSGANSYLSATELFGGVMEVGLNSNLGDASAPLAFDGGTLRTTGSFNIGRNPSLAAGGGSIETVGSNTLTATAAFSGVGGLTKLGSGTLRMGGASSYTGATMIDAGTLELASTERLADATDVTVAAGATFDLASFNETIDALSGAGTVSLGLAALNVGIDNGSGTFSGSITGSGDLFKQGVGTQTLTGVNTYSGATFVDGGELILASGGQINQSTTFLGFNIGSSGVATADGAGTMWSLSGDLFVGQEGLGRMNITNDAIVAVDGTVRIGNNSQGPASAGTVSLDGGTLDNSTGNGVSVINGRLQGAGVVLADVNNLSTTAPGNSAGILNITGDYTQGTDATLEIEVGGNDNSVTAQFDVLNVSGNLGLDGMLDLALLGGFTPAPADTFTVATANVLAGVFTNVASGARLDISGGGTGSFRVDYGPGSPFGTNLIVLSDFIGMGSAGGDFDGNGTLEGDDIDSLVDAIASGSTNLAFDLNGDSVVDGTDLTEWLAIAGAANLPSGNPYLVGDSDLDGTVDLTDYDNWNDNRFTSMAAWTGGDFNADGFTDGRDLLLWNTNKFLSADGGLTLIPEPTSGWLLLLALVGWVVTQRRRRSIGQ